MTGGFKAAHIDTDLGDDHLGGERADARNAVQHFEGDPKRFDVAVDLLIDASDGRVLGIDLIQMQLQHKAMMIRHPAAQRRFQLRRGGVNPPICQCG